VLALLAGACGSAPTRDAQAKLSDPPETGAPGTDTTSTTTSVATSEGGWLGSEDGERDWGDSAALSGAATDGEMSGGAMRDDAMSDDAMMESAPAVAAGDASPRESERRADGLTAEGDVVDPTDSEPFMPPDTGPVDTSLNAGSVDDNEEWEDYLLYLQDADAAGVAHSPIDIRGRHIIEVVTPDGDPVLGARITVSDPDGNVVSTSTSHADGRSLFLAPAVAEADAQNARPQRTITAERDGTEASSALDGNSTSTTIELDVTQPAPLALDLHFLIDTTGSMGDEIAQLKANMVSIAEQIDALPGETDARFAMTVYRDRGEAFVTRTFDFTDDVEQFSDALAEVTADGGGDEPEDLNAGLHEALEAPSWRAAPAVQLVVLVADAPPHLDYEDGPDYAEDALLAAERGIKILPVASSGLNPVGQYTFRQLAQVTMGTFVFLTYGADGASPGEARDDLDVDDFSVLSLDDLVVALVTEELSHQQG